MGFHPGSPPRIPLQIHAIKPKINTQQTAVIADNYPMKMFLTPATPILSASSVLGETHLVESYDMNLEFIGSESFKKIGVVRPLGYSSNQRNHVPRLWSNTPIVSSSFDATQFAPSTPLTNLNDESAWNTFCAVAKDKYAASKFEDIDLRLELIHAHLHLVTDWKSELTRVLNPNSDKSTTVFDRILSDSYHNIKTLHDSLVYRRSLIAPPTASIDHEAVIPLVQYKGKDTVTCHRQGAHKDIFAVIDEIRRMSDRFSDFENYDQGGMFYDCLSEISELFPELQLMEDEASGHFIWRGKLLAPDSMQQLKKLLGDVILLAVTHNKTELWHAAFTLLIYSCYYDNENNSKAVSYYSNSKIDNFIRTNDDQRLILNSDSINTLKDILIHQHAHDSILDFVVPLVINTLVLATENKKSALTDFLHSQELSTVSVEDMNVQLKSKATTSRNKKNLAEAIRLHAQHETLGRVLTDIKQDKNWTAFYQHLTRIASELTKSELTTLESAIGSPLVQFVTHVPQMLESLQQDLSQKIIPTDKVKRIRFRSVKGHDALKVIDSGEDCQNRQGHLKAVIPGYDILAIYDADDDRNLGYVGWTTAWTPSGEHYIVLDAVNPSKDVMFSGQALLETVANIFDAEFASDKTYKGILMSSNVSLVSNRDIIADAAAAYPKFEKRSLTARVPQYAGSEESDLNINDDDEILEFVHINDESFIHILNRNATHPDLDEAITKLYDTFDNFLNTISKYHPDINWNLFLNMEDWFRGINVDRAYDGYRTEIENQIAFLEHILSKGKNNNKSSQKIKDIIRDTVRFNAFTTFYYVLEDLKYFCTSNFKIDSIKKYSSKKSLEAAAVKKQKMRRPQWTPDNDTILQVDISSPLRALRLRSES